MGNQNSAEDNERHQKAGAAKPTDENGLEQTQFASLLAQAKRGDRKAINELCSLSQKYLLLIANQNLEAAVLQKVGASDMVQQSLVIANQKICGFQGETQGEFLAWMKQILINECRQTRRGFQQTAKRNIGRERGLDSAGSPSRQFQIADQFLTPSSEAVANEQMKLVEEVLREMSEVDRQVIQLRNWRELSFDEIGQQIGKSPDASRKIWSRAILKLENELRRRNAI